MQPEPFWKIICYEPGFGLTIVLFWQRLRLRILVRVKVLLSKQQIVRGVYRNSQEKVYERAAAVRAR